MVRCPNPSLAIDPRDTSVWTAGSNDYCAVPTAGDAWVGFYRSINGGLKWTDSLLPAYKGDTATGRIRTTIADTRNPMPI